MDWNYAQIRKRSWDTGFRKSRKSWLMLVITAFLFALVGASNGSQTEFINLFDKYIGGTQTFLAGNENIIEEYILKVPGLRNIHIFTSELTVSILDGLTRSLTWVVKLFSALIALALHKPLKTVVVLLVSAFVTMLVKFLVLNVLLVGRDRFLMENRFAKEVSFERILAPFRWKSLGNVIKVTLIYKLNVALWSFTIVGGFYKYYQYFAVPYLLAENPEISWKEAKKLSSEMTEGYKLSMFLTYLSFFYIWIFKYIPFTGLLIAVPFEMTMNCEMFFAIREKYPENSELFAEPAFSALPYVEKEAEPEFVLEDFSLPDDGKRGYSLLEYVYIFLVCSFMGWLWECGLHIYFDNELVNRGTLYGPWIPVYGFGGTAMVFLLNRFKDKVLKLTLIGMLICAAMEYVTSYILESIFDSMYWDYTNRAFNLDGRICLGGVTAFTLGGMVVIYLVAPVMMYFVRKMPEKKQNMVASVICLIYLADYLFCLFFGFNRPLGIKA